MFCLLTCTELVPGLIGLSDSWSQIPHSTFVLCLPMLFIRMDENCVCVFSESCSGLCSGQKQWPHTLTSYSECLRALLDLNWDKELRVTKLAMAAYKLLPVLVLLFWIAVSLKQKTKTKSCWSFFEAWPCPLWWACWYLPSHPSWWCCAWS